jgi:hypothetical protein
VNQLRTLLLHKLQRNLAMAGLCLLGKRLSGFIGFALVGWAISGTSPANAAEDKKSAIIPPIDQRFAPGAEKDAPLPEETPDFRRHVLPLMGKLGCNGRACHGSFQGQGGFRLSLFGYDFKADHDALSGIQLTLDGKPIPGKAAKVDPRYNKAEPTKSLILTKPTEVEDHEGGKRMDLGSWEYRVIHKWVAAGAPEWKSDSAEIDRLEVLPSEIVFKKAGDTVKLRVLAHWKDGSVEDVTKISRFRSNDESIAKIAENGIVTCLTKGDTHVVAFYDNGVLPVPTMLPVSDKNSTNYPKVVTTTKIDELVLTKLKKVGLVPSENCKDEEFLRRVRLDMTGTLPAPAEIEAFLADTAKDKRNKKIDELLATDEYTAWWSTRLSDLTGNNPRQFNNGGNLVRNTTQMTAKQWYNWIYERVAENKPYDEIIAGILVSKTLEGDQSYLDYSKQYTDEYRENNSDNFAKRETMPHYWARRNLRNAEEKVMGFCYTFMGIQIQCAQCHKHPFDQWTKQDFDQFKPFFERIGTGLPPQFKTEQQALMKDLGTTADPKLKQQEYRKEIEAAIKAGKTYPAEFLVFNRPTTNAPPKAVDKDKEDKNKKNQRAPVRAVPGKLLGGDSINLAEIEDPREALLHWLRTEPNHFLARAFVNRVWAGYFNVGIIHPTDDASLANPPSNAALLKYLTDGFIANKYDMKWLHRTIAQSDTYQRSWQPNETNKLDTRNFSRAIPRRLQSEIAYDALMFASAGDKERETTLNNPKSRAIGVESTLAQGNGALNYPLVVFGKPERATNCDCERSNEPSLLQCVFTQNDGQLLTAMERNSGWLKQLEATWKAANKTVAAKPEAANAKGGDKQREERKNLIAMIEKRIERQKEKGNTAEVEQMQAKLKELKGAKEEAAKPEVAAKPTVPVDPMAGIDQDALIREAYLRTLSRHPIPQEVDRAKQHFADSKTPISAVRDLMWALVNTKEFIVNH